MKSLPSIENITPRVSPPPSHHVHALELRKEGKTYRQIADEVGFKDAAYASHVCARVIQWNSGVRRG